MLLDLLFNFPPLNSLPERTVPTSTEASPASAEDFAQLLESFSNITQVIDNKEINNSDIADISTQILLPAATFEVAPAEPAVAVALPIAAVVTESAAQAIPADQPDTAGISSVLPTPVAIDGGSSPNSGNLQPLTGNHLQDTGNRLPAARPIDLLEPAIDSAHAGTDGEAAQRFVAAAPLVNAASAVTKTPTGAAQPLTSQPTRAELPGNGATGAVLMTTAMQAASPPIPAAVLPPDPNPAALTATITATALVTASVVPSVEQQRVELARAERIVAGNSATNGDATSALLIDSRVESSTTAQNRPLIIAPLQPQDMTATPVTLRSTALPVGEMPFVEMPMARPPAVADVQLQGTASSQSVAATALEREPISRAVDTQATTGSVSMTSEPARSEHAAARAEVAASTAQLSGEVARQIFQAHNRNLTQLRMQLNPEELGQLDLRLRVDGDRVHVAIVAQHASARDLLEAQLPQLRALLQEGGFQLGDVDVRHHGSGNRDGYPTDPHPGQSGTPGLELLAADAAAENGSRRRPDARDRLIDAFA